MENGTDLKGHPSSSQSAIIIPVPESCTQYYIFTVGTAASLVPDGPWVSIEGFHHSLVDMAANGGDGAVIEKNIPLLAGCSERLTALKIPDEDSYWVISLAAPDGTSITYADTFYAYKVTNLGIAPPVISTSTTFFDRRGYMKVSPDGKWLAATGIGDGLFLYQFDLQTGLISQKQKLELDSATIAPYGVEFSPQSKKLYATGYNPKMNPDDPLVQKSSLYQFDLESTDIQTSRVIVDKDRRLFRGALQLGPDGRIYRALSFAYEREFGSNYLGVIEQPEKQGIDCNYKHNAIHLKGKLSTQGLPPFSQSLFKAKLEYDVACEQEATTISLTDKQNAQNNAWTITNELGAIIASFQNTAEITYTFPSKGIYILEIKTTQCPLGEVIEEQITVHPKPSPKPTTLVQCDTDADGVSFFNLTEANQLLSPRNHQTETFSYHRTLQDATLNRNPIADSIYFRAEPSKQDVFYVRVTSALGCSATTELRLSLANTSIPASLQLTYTACDNMLDGDDENGLSYFDFSEATAKILATFTNPQDLSVSYYETETDALTEQNQISNYDHYYNTTPFSQKIWVRVDHKNYNSCMGLSTPITLEVLSVPNIKPLTVTECGKEGMFNFQLSSLANSIVEHTPNLTVDFYKNQVDAENGVNKLENELKTESSTIYARISNANQCFRITPIELIVNALPSLNILDDFLYCDNAIDGLTTVDFTEKITEILENHENLEINLYETATDAHENTNPISKTSYLNSSSQQTIFVRATDPLNDCFETGSFNLRVVSAKAFSPTPLEQCDTDRDGLTTYDLSSKDNEILGDQANMFVLYFSSLEDAANAQNPLPKTFANTTKEQTLYARVQHLKHDCFDLTELELITHIPPTLLGLQHPTNNSILIEASGDSLTYSLNGYHFQESNLFTDLAPGEYTLFVKAGNSCASLEETIKIIEFPSFFTPNGDGYHDTWHIKGHYTYSEIEVFVFDRMGKFIIRLTEESAGWDGRYRDKLLPADDYWYRATITEFGKTTEYKGHFVLKR